MTSGYSRSTVIFEHGISLGGNDGCTRGRRLDVGGAILIGSDGWMMSQ